MVVESKSISDVVLPSGKLVIDASKAAVVAVDNGLALESFVLYDASGVELILLAAVVEFCEKIDVDVAIPAVVFVRNG